MIFEKHRIKKHLLENKMKLIEYKDAILYSVNGGKQDFISNWNGFYYIKNEELYFMKKKLLLFKNNSTLEKKVTWAIKANKYIETENKIIIDFIAPHDKGEGVFSRLEIQL